MPFFGIFGIFFRILATLHPYRVWRDIIWQFQHFNKIFITFGSLTNVKKHLEKRILWSAVLYTILEKNHHIVENYLQDSLRFHVVDKIF